MSKWWTNLKRFWRRTRTDAEYALLFHKVSRRLGIARARARQAENEIGYLSDQLAEYRKDITAKVRELTEMLVEEKLQGATAGLHRRIGQLQDECAALHAECLSLRMANAKAREPKHDDLIEADANTTTQKLERGNGVYPPGVIGRF